MKTNRMTLISLVAIVLVVLAACSQTPAPQSQVPQVQNAAQSPAPQAQIPAKDILSVQSASSGTVVGWGSNSFGQTTVSSGLSDIAALAAGVGHSLTLKSDGTVVAWGSNSFGQITVPTGLSNITAIAAGGYHSLALKSDGTVVAWGRDNSGQTDVPAGLGVVTAIAAGDRFSLALKSDGTVVVWGDNSFGQATVPPGLNAVTAIAAGDIFGLAISAGTVVVWGSNSAGQTNVPAGLSNVVAIAAAYADSVALKSDGTVVSWGRNRDGAFTVPAGLNSVIAIATGNDHTLAISTDATGPSVTINQAAGQVDPTLASPIHFTATFSEAVTGLTDSDVVLSGTAGATTASVTGGPSSYDIAVSGMTTSGTVIASLAANVATDAVGNGNTASTSTDNTVTFNSDTTPPVITPIITGTLGLGGWYKSDVNLTWSVTDGESTISNQTGCGAQNVTSDTTGVIFTCSATSPGGTDSKSVTIKRDATVPSITFASRTPANGAGWNNINVVVNWNCTDAASGAVSATVSQTVSSEGANQSSTGACTDNAGNSASNSQAGISIDKTAPTLNPLVSPNSVVLGGSATVSSGASDGLSGLASQSCGSVVASSVGMKSVTCTATDYAGNTGTAGASYSVIYNFAGFFSPVDNLPTLNQIKAGSAIPVKFSLGGNQGLNILAANSPGSQAISCSSSAPVDDIEQTVTAGNSSLSYDAGSGTYSYVWKTDKSWAGQCRQLIVTLSDGTDHVANFKFR